MPRRYWLVKTEPQVFSFEDLWNAPARTAGWDGVRNYQARNTLRDEMKKGDLVFIYHSSTDTPAIIGTAEVVREGYPDETAFDPRHDHFDPKSKRDAPSWYQVDLQAKERLARPVTLPEMRAEKSLSGMKLLAKGMRLSVQPVSAEEWKTVIAMSKK